METFFRGLGLLNQWQLLTRNQVLHSHYEGNTILQLMKTDQLLHT